MTAVGFSGEVLVLDSGETRSSGTHSDLRQAGPPGEPNLVDRLLQQAAKQPTNIALSTANRHWSYQELLSAISEVANAIRSRPQFVPGARVLLLLSNSFEYVAAFYGTLLAGGVVVPLPPTIEEQGFERICESTIAVAVIIAAGSRRLPSVLKDRPRHQVPLSQPAAIDGASAVTRGPGTNPLAAIFFTSGSTGDPKGVMLSHQNLIANAVSIQQYLKISDADRPLCVLPFYHAFGNSVLQSHLLAGATLILDGNTLFPETLLTAINRHQATSLSGVPDLFRMLLERTSLGRTPLPSLRYLALAGGALRHGMAVEMADRIAPARFFVMYGQTEATARLAYVPPERLKDLPPGCIGVAIPGVKLEIVDDQNRQVKAGETGELRAMGPNVMLGYWNDPVATAERIRDGWLYTGDLATADEQGWIVHRGRQNAIVKIAGFRVHPGDLEEFAIRRLAVSHAVAVAFEQPQVGTRLALFIVRPKVGSMSTSEILVRCRDELPRHLVPSSILVLDEFPMNSSMKIDRVRLSRMAEEQPQGTRHEPVRDESISEGVGS